MPQVIQEWLGTRLGIIVDLSPENFGRNTKDGRLLAKLLHSYGIIPPKVLDEIKPTKYTKECYHNLQRIKPWLDYLGVPNEDCILQEVADSKGSAAIRLFYALYLSLENKDAAHFALKQKERKVSDGCSKRPFTVNWVPETEIRGSSGHSESNLALPLAEKEHMIKWHQDKCANLVFQIKNLKNKFLTTVGKTPELHPVISKYTTSQVLPKKLVEVEQANNDIRMFERKHIRKPENMAYDELKALQDKFQSSSLRAVPNLQEAKNFVDSIKRRNKRKVVNRTFQQRMQSLVLDELWKKVLEEQEAEFDQRVCESLLKQSQYEKQMCCKLFLVKHQKKVLAENRKLIEKLILTEREKEFQDALNQRIEIEVEEAEEAAFEKLRQLELHKRLYTEKVRLRMTQRIIEVEDIIRGITDIAIRVSEYRTENDRLVPKHMMKDMKELFFKNLPIFDAEKHSQEKASISEEEEEEVDNAESIAMVEYERRDVLNECDFDDYLHLLGPWLVELLIPDCTESDGNQTVLGYVVHKLLQVKYPLPPAPIRPDIKPMTPTAVVQGVNDEKAAEMLKDLMETRRILVVTVQDAINYVLMEYKQELSVVRDIDVNFQKATKTALKGKDKGKIDKPPNKKEKLAAGDVKKGGVKDEPIAKEVETQTPRKIPEDDPLLSPNAELGRIAFEALGLGDSVPDFVIVSAVIAYVSSKQDEYNGWLLLDYPLSYSQARLVECTLTGYQLMPAEEETDTIEEIEGYAMRGNFRDPNLADRYEQERVSRLVPRPEPKEFPPPPKTYFSAFVVTKKKDLPDEEEASPLLNFYIQQQVLYNFEYVLLNFQAVKGLAKLLLNEPEEKPSVEIFGDALPELTKKWAPVKGKVDPKKSQPNTLNVTKLEPELITTPASTVSVEVSPLPPAKPGAPNWIWADGPQPEELQIAMASHWENMEAVYIEDLKQVFYCLRIHHSQVVRYSTFVKKSMRAFMRRPDDKQRLLSGFQSMFNDIDKDLRPDVDIKCELHVRVCEFESALLEIADDRRTRSEAQRVGVVAENWVPDQLASLINYYVTVLQLEADRCVDSLQVISDYYTTLLQKLPEDTVVAKLVIPRLQIHDRKYSVLSSSSLPKTSSFTRSPRSSRGSRSKGSIDKGNKTKRKRTSDDSFLTGASDTISGVLIACSLPEDATTPFHVFFVDAISKTANDLTNIAADFASAAKKFEKTNPQVFMEWSSAVNAELKRFLFRAKLIKVRGLLDVDELLSEMLNTFWTLSDEIGGLYMREMESISQCCKVFRCAIEEESGIQPQLRLDIDEFAVQHDFPLFPDEDAVSDAESEPSKTRFTIEQLSVLYEKFRRVAPDGEIIRRSFIYILEDLRAMKSEDGSGRFFPEIWDALKPDDIAWMCQVMYQKLEIINWRDFIIYALELPFPTEADVLEMRKQFRRFDVKSTELVTRDDYEKIEFWFDDENEAPRETQAKDFLFRMFQTDETHINYSALLLAFCKDHDPAIGFVKALTLALGKGIRLRDHVEEVSQTNAEAEEAAAEIMEEILADMIQHAEGCIVKEIREDPVPVKSCHCDTSSSSSLRFSGEARESYSSFYPFQKPETVTVVPSEVVSSVILSSFPSLPQLTILLNCEYTLNETLRGVYESLQLVNDEVQAYELIQHEFIYNLLTSTNKFKIVCVSSILCQMTDECP